jgi:hypothetical protein
MSISRATIRMAFSIRWALTGCMGARIAQMAAD